MMKGAALWLMVVLLFPGCKISYKFNSGDVGDAKTFTIHDITNNAPLINPALAQIFTEALKQKLLSSTNLNMVESNGDLEFSGTITNYQVTVASATANETASLNRLSITVNIEFVNHKDDKKSWTTAFSRYSDFDSNKDLATVQSQLIDDIDNQLTEDIFNKALVNW